MEENDEINIDASSASLEDVEDTDNSTVKVVRHIMEKYKKAETNREQDEIRWLKAYKNYRGLYDSDVQFTEAEKSRVFIKTTKTKTLAAYGQLADVLFAGNKFPLTIEPTELPEGVIESVSLDPQKPDEVKRDPNESPYGFDGDGRDIPAGATEKTLMESLGPLSEKLKDVEGLEQGAGQTPSAITFHPAMIAAKKMEKKIHDQLEESGANKQLRNTAFEMALFGTGIMKGPFALDKEYPNWGEDGEYDPLIKTVPSTSHVSMWNFYPDPDAYNMDEAEYCVERHKLSKTQMRNLKNRPYFRDESIEACLDMGAQYDKKYWEDDMKDYAIENYTERYEVLEFWGYVDADILEENGVEIPEELGDVYLKFSAIQHCSTILTVG